MAFIDRLVALWKYERRWMQGVLEGLKFGETKIEPWPPKAGQVDKTAGDMPGSEHPWCRSSISPTASLLGLSHDGEVALLP